MNKALFIHEFKMISRSRKNILFIITLVALMLSYFFIILPVKQTPDSFDSNEVKLELKDLAAVQEGKKARGATGFSYMSGRAVFAENEYAYNVRNRMVYAFDDGNYTRFLRLRMIDMANNYMSQSMDEAIIRDSPFPGKDINHRFNQTIIRYEGYLTENHPITYKVIEQKTALQTVKQFLVSSAVLIVLFCAIYFSSDMLTKDRKNQSIMQGLPISWYRRINLKTTVAFFYTLLVLTGLLFLSIIVLTIQNGFGSFSMHVPISMQASAEELAYGNYYAYDFISMGRFFLLALGYLPILIYLFIRLNAILSLLLKNTWGVLMVGTIFLFSERIYFTRTTRDLFGIEISNLPQTYFDLGKIIVNDKNFLVNLETMTYEKGLLVLCISLVIVEVTLFIVSRIVNKRRFYYGV
ncbi:hypothetical protein [Virgibacillus sp. MG-45]|uniref:hypothetical protein n=1 Tax=Virgibacillus sp. MG-45 TaxID=3102791 RepID=UPI002ED8D63E